MVGAAKSWHTRRAGSQPRSGCRIGTGRVRRSDLPTTEGEVSQVHALGTRWLRYGLVMTALAVFGVAMTAGGAVAARTAASSKTSAAASQDLAHPTKALCKKSSYKIGYDVF